MEKFADVEATHVECATVRSSYRQGTVRPPLDLEEDSHAFHDVDDP
jgi:hypothetical protein